MNVVLLVDRDEDFLALARRALDREQGEFDLLTARDGKEARALLARTPIDLLIAGLAPPDLDGFDMLTYISETYPALPVAALTDGGETRAADLKRFPCVASLQRRMDASRFAGEVQGVIGRLARGRIEGVTLFGLMQLLSVEGRTCVLDVRARELHGRIWLVAGEVVHAEAPGLSGLSAVYAMLGWATTGLGLSYVNQSFEQTIQHPLVQILLEAAHRHDDAARVRSASPAQHAWTTRLGQDLKGAPSSQAADAAPYEARDEASQPLQRLRALIQEKAAGEFVVAADAFEAHVHLQGGQIVWATSSAAHGSFARHLLAKALMRADEIREVLDDCQRTRRPVIETLVQWNLATLEQVRDALREQVREALATLGRLPALTSSIFLRRTVKTHQNIVFDLDEVAPTSPRPSMIPPPAAAALCALRSVPPPSAPRAIEPSWAELEAQARDLARSLDEARLPVDFAAISDAERSAVVGGEIRPRSDALLQQLSVYLLETGAGMLAFRCGHGVLVGARLGATSVTFWCGFSDTQYGPGVAVLAHLIEGAASAEAPRSLFAPYQPTSGALPSTDLSALEGEIARLDVHGGLFALDEEAGKTLSVGTRPDAPAAARAAAAASLGRILHMNVEVLLPGSRADDLTAPPTGSLLLAYETVWCIGGLVSQAPALQVWIAFDRLKAQGLGWIFLADLQRNVEKLRAASGWSTGLSPGWETDKTTGEQRG